MVLCLLRNKFIDSISTPENNQVINSRGNKVALPRIYRKKFMGPDQLKAKGKVINELVQIEKEQKEKQVKQWGFDVAKQDLTEKQLRQNKLKEAIKKRSKI